VENCSPFGGMTWTFPRVNFASAPTRPVMVGGWRWQPAVRAAGLNGFRFHDCRHTFASRLVNDGVDRYVVQAAGGWKTASMMQRYAQLEPTTIRAAVERLAHRSAGANGHQNGHRGRVGAESDSGEVSVTT
jgi:integrase